MTNPRENFEQAADQETGPTVLIVDDEEMCRKQMSLLCSNLESDRKLEILTAGSLLEARDLINKHKPIQVMLLDKNLGWKENDPDNDGIEAIPEFLEAQPQMQILVVTSSKEISDCVQAMKYGALGYVLKSYPDEVKAAQIQKAINVSSVMLQNLRFDRGMDNAQSFDLAGTSTSIQSLKRTLRAVARNEEPVLLLGESGTGKSTAARIIHNLRQQHLMQKGPFFQVNMAAIAPSLAEGELFGSEKGAFTNSIRMKLGYFELAHKGSLFLDEIGETTPELQAKLLKAIDEKKIIRLGGEQEREFRLKLVCATNRDLEQMIREGSFREDLYYRINTLVVKIPPLSERIEDIPAIIQSLLPRCCASNNVRVTYDDLPSDFIHYLMENPTKGNVRGIKQAITRLLTYAPTDKSGQPVLKNWRRIPGIQLRKERNIRLAVDPLNLKDLTERPYDVVESNGPKLKEILENVRSQVILDANRKFKLQMDAAKALGIAGSTYSEHVRSLKNSNRTIEKQIAKPPNRSETSRLARARPLEASL